MNPQSYKKIFLLLAAMFACVSCDATAQRRQSKLKFDSVTFDFGTIDEADGPVAHTFTFTNTGSSAVVIEKVDSDCGCTVPEYDRKPVEPKKTGKIEVIMNPAGYSGYMSKCVTVVCNDGKNRGYTKLCLTANVVPRPRTIAEDYPFEVGGGVRAASLYAGFGTIANNSSHTETIALVNDSEKTASLRITSLPEGGPVRAGMPGELPPRGKGEVTITYDLVTGGPVYGLLSDRIYFSVNGEQSATPITMHAVAVDDFSAIDPAFAPHATISPVFHNFKAVRPGATVAKEFTITNTGDGPLIIRDVTSRRHTFHDLAVGQVIEPGASLTVTLGMTLPQDVSGAVAGGITIIFNDPDRPVRDIRVVAEAKK